MARTAAAASTKALHCALVVEGRCAAPRRLPRLLRQLRDRPADPAAFDAWALGVLRAFDRLRVLCAVREGPQGVATSMRPSSRRWPMRSCCLRAAAVVRRPPGDGDAQRHDLGVFNGDIGIARRHGRAGRARPLRVYFLDADARCVRCPAAASPKSRTAFALTVHKSQGGSGSGTFVLHLAGR
ncbi:MAG: hypothetical protein U1F49_04310 [Rubrivivax sp.]